MRREENGNQKGEENGLTYGFIACFVAYSAAILMLGAHIGGSFGTAMICTHLFMLALALLLFMWYYEGGRP